MTLPQQHMLLGLFATLANARHWNGTQREIERERITIALFGERRSWSAAKDELDDRDIDRLKARLIALRDETNIPAQIDDANAADDGERRRLIHRIEHDLRRAQLGEGYVVTIARDQCDRADWRDLPIEQLTNLRDTLTQRVRRRRAARRAPAPAPTRATAPFDPETIPF